MKSRSFEPWDWNSYPKLRLKPGVKDYMERQIGSRATEPKYTPIIDRDDYEEIRDDDANG